MLDPLLGTSEVITYSTNDGLLDKDLSGILLGAELGTVDGDIFWSDDGLSLGTLLGPLLGIAECNDDGTVNGEYDGIFDGTLLVLDLGAVEGTILGSNDRSNLDNSIWYIRRYRKWH